MCVLFDKGDFYERMGKSQKTEWLRPPEKEGQVDGLRSQRMREVAGPSTGPERPSELVRTGGERQGLGGHLRNWLWSS